MADETLDTAWRVLSLGFNSESEDTDGASWLERKYDIDGDRLMEYYDALIEDEEITEELLASMFFLGFEFGKIHEKNEKDMKSIMGE